jgi:hypothetical protein
MTLPQKAFVGAGESFQSVPVQTVLVGATVLGGGLASGTAVGGTILKSTAGKIGLGYLGYKYVGEKYTTLKGFYQTGDTEALKGETLITFAELGAMSYGGRAAIKESTMIQAKALPPKQRAEFFKKFEAVEKLKAPKIREVDLSKVERIPSKN